MPIGVYVRTEYHNRINSEGHKGKPLNHKVDCKCCICKAVRGEFDHKLDCCCPICRVKRGEKLEYAGRYARTEVILDKLHKANIGKKCSAETIEKMRTSASKVHSVEHNLNVGKALMGKFKGKLSGRWGKSPNHPKRSELYFDVPNQGRVCFRSSWELIAAKYFVAKKVDFRYECKRFILDAKTFLPDFYLVKEDKFIEVKGWVTEDALQKMREMSIFHPDIKIEMITEKEIKQFRNYIEKGIV